MLAPAPSGEHNYRTTTSPRPPLDSRVFFPIGTDRPLHRPTRVTHALIAVTLLAWIADIALRGPGEGPGPLANALRLSSPSIAYSPWSLVGYAFAHAGIWHILGNLVFLWTFGPNVEDRLGRLGFLALYLFGAAAAGLAHIAFSPAPVVGASGAVAAVTGAYIVLFPRTRIRTLVIFIIIGFWNIPAAWFIGFAVARDIIGLGLPSNVAYAAHLGGYVFGFLVAFVLLATGRLKREPYDLFQIARQARRRAEIREAVRGSSTPRPLQRATAAPEPHDPAAERVALLRTELAEAVAAGVPARALRAHDELLALAGDARHLAFARSTQLGLANLLFAAERHAHAAGAYDRFLSAHPTDDQAPHARLVLGLLRARYLGDPTSARPLLERAAREVSDPADRDLALALLAEIPPRTA